MKTRIALLGVLICVVRPVAAQSPIQVFTSLNHGAQTTLLKGWPLLVHTDILHPHPFSQERSVLVAAAAEDWNRAVSFAMTGPDGKTFPITLQLASTPSDTEIDLAPDEVIGMEWVMSPEATARLSEGDYLFEAAFNVKTAQEGATVVLKSEKNQLSVAVDPINPNVALAGIKATSISEYYMRIGDYSQAALILDKQLQNGDKQYLAVILRAQLFELQGDVVSAFQLAQLAIGLWDAKAEEHDPKEPPRQQSSCYDACRRRFPKSGVH